jgi:uncharacterized protein DUF4199
VKRTVLVFGLASGVLSLVFMAISLPMMLRGDYSRSEVVGYTGLALAAIIIFVGIRSYRATTGGGYLTFWRGLAVGASIAAVAGTIYASAWLVLSTAVMPGITDKVAGCIVAQKRSFGASDAEIVEAEKFADTYRRLARNPAINFAMTFAESFPVGLAASILAAAVLRRKGPPSPAAAGAEAKAVLS